MSQLWRYVMPLEGNKIPGLRCRRVLRDFLPGHRDGLASKEQLWFKLGSSWAAHSLSNARVLVLGFDGEERRNLMTGLRSLQVGSVASALDIGQLGDLSVMNQGFSHVLLNFDAFADVAAGVDALLAFRGRCPDVWPASGFVDSGLS